jgi:hypothetical protein
VLDRLNHVLPYFADLLILSRSPTGEAQEIAEQSACHATLIGAVLMGGTHSCAVAVNVIPLPLLRRTEWGVHRMESPIHNVGHFAEQIASVGQLILQAREVFIRFQDSDNFH